MSVPVFQQLEAAGRTQALMCSERAKDAGDRRKPVEAREWSEAAAAALQQTLMAQEARLGLEADARDRVRA